MAKVLIVEDDTLLSKILQKRFEAVGLETRVAFDGVIGEHVIKSWHPNLVLLDLLLPNMDGFELMKIVRSDPKTAKTHIVILSNLNDKESIDRAKELGVTEFVTKSSTTPDLIAERIAEMLHKK